MSAEPGPTPVADAWVFEGGGEMGTLIAAFDWTATPLGPLSAWSHCLKATVAMLVHSRHPMFLWWGSELIQIYNDAYKPSFGIGKHPAALGQRGHECWPEVWGIIGPQIDDVMTRGVPSWHEDALVPIFRNGAIEDVYWTYGYSPVFDDDGSIGGTLVVCTETTGRVVAARSEQRARMAAELASRAKDDFLSTASHELRTPLNAILGWARMLQAGGLPDAAYLRAVDSIERNARIQVRLIEDILDGSRIITGKLQLETKPLDLTAVLQAALDSVRAAADAKRIALTVTVDPAAARMIGDPERLQQVIWNLANNAIKFTPKEGAVHVDLVRRGTDVQLTVTDNGEGIPPDFLPHVFERFRQAEGSTTRRHGGLGLGLALVRHLVEAHGGTVHADSDGPGHGSVFTIRLPVQAVFEEAALVNTLSAAATRPFVARAVNLAGTAILVVDDEADARDLVATVLRSKGAEVTAAASASEAFALIATRRFTAMVSDIGMPVSDGYELIRRVRGVANLRGDRLPAVALTAYSRDEDRRRVIDAGFQAYVAKPVEPDDLLEVVHRLVVDALKGSTEPADAGTDALNAFAKVLEAQGVHEALRFLNSRASHRFTGIYRFDAPTLRNLALLDADTPALTRGDDAPLEESYCSIVGVFERPFASEDSARDQRLLEHPARDSVRSYCGVLLRTADGAPFGTLCHFDLVPREVPVEDIALMEAAAPLVMAALRAGSPPPS